jgi:signal transduction histidine kinase
MHKSDYPYLADWFAISLRWLGLLGIIAALAFAGAIQIRLAAVVLVSIVWNTYTSILAVLNRRLTQQRILNVWIDSLVSISLFFLSGELGGPLAWANLLALFSAAIYFEWRGSLITAIILSALEAGGIYLFDRAAFYPLTLVLFSAFNLAAAGLLGFICYQLMQRLRDNYKNRLLQRKEQLRRERERIRGFSRSIESFCVDLDPGSILETLLDMSADLLGGAEPPVDRMVSAALLVESGSLIIQSTRGISEEMSEYGFPARQGILAEAAQAGTVQQSLEPFNDPELNQISWMSDMHSAVCVPLIYRESLFGALLFAHPQESFFDEDRVEMLTIVSQPGAIALQNARLFNDLQHEKIRMMQTQEDTRRELARELHDGPTQTMSSIAMRANIARKMLERGTGDVQGEIQALEDLARQTTQEVRHLLFLLRPLESEMDALESAMQEMAQKLKETHQQTVTLDLDSNLIQKLNTDQQAIIYYLVEEAITTARKTGKADKTLVRLRPMPENIDTALLDIMDNGTGAGDGDTSNAFDQRGNLGMVNLRERTERLNGVLQIDSLPGKGTRVRIFIPLNLEAVDRLHHGSFNA